MLFFSTLDITSLISFSSIWYAAHYFKSNKQEILYCKQINKTTQTVVCDDFEINTKVNYSE